MDCDKCAVVAAVAGGSVRGKGGYAPDNQNKWISRWLLRREADAATDRAMNIGSRCGDGECEQNEAA